MDVTIKVVQKPMSRTGLAFSQTVFWTLLVGAVGLSRVWFGGAWIVDVLAALFSFTVMYAVGRRFIGADVTLTVDEAKKWIACGCPPDVKMWQIENRYRVGESL